MQIEMWLITRVRPYDQNPRNNDAAVDAVARSIQEFGFRQPIVVDPDGVIIVGHTRYKAALKLGMTEVPVHVAIGLTPAQIKAYRIADNQTSSIADWDFDLLPLEISDLKSLDFNIDLLGFGPDEMARILRDEVQDGQCDPDEVPEPPDAATTQPGDLWILGDHRLLCADSSKPEDLDRLLDGAAIHLVNTDPPYNVKVEPRSNNAIAAGLSSFQGTTHHQKLDVAARIRGSRSRRRRSFAPKTGHWRTTSSPTQSSIGCSTPGSATSPVSCCPGGRSTAGAATPTAPIIRQLLKTARTVLQPGHDLGQRASGPDPERLHGQSRVVFLLLERRGRSRLSRPEQCHRRLEREEGQPAVDGPSHREAGGTGRAGDAVFVAAGRERARSCSGDREARSSQHSRRAARPS